MAIIFLDRSLVCTLALSRYIVARFCSDAGYLDRLAAALAAARGARQPPLIAHAASGQGGGAGDPSGLVDDIDVTAMLLEQHRCHIDAAGLPGRGRVAPARLPR